MTTPDQYPSPPQATPEFHNTFFRHVMEDETRDTIEITTGHFICAWCGEDIGESGTVEDSHGICPDCLKFLRPEEATDDQS